MAPPVSLDPECPIAPLLPYLADPSATSSWYEQVFQQLNSAAASSAGLVLLTTGLVLLTTGARLVKPAVFLSAALIGSVSAFYVTEATLSSTSASPTTGCYALMIAPVALGLLAGGMAVKLLDTAFVAVGAAAGAAVGYIAYALVLRDFPLGVSFLAHDITYWLCTAGLAFVGGLMMRRLEYRVLVLATSVLGGALLVPALALLLLGRLDARFLWVLEPPAASSHLASPFVWAQALGGVFYAYLGVRYQSQPRQRVKAERSAFFVTSREPLLYVRP